MEVERVFDSDLVEIDEIAARISTILYDETRLVFVSSLDVAYKMKQLFEESCGLGRGRVELYHEQLPDTEKYRIRGLFNSCLCCRISDYEELPIVITTDSEGPNFGGRWFDHIFSVNPETFENFYERENFARFDAYHFIYHATDFVLPLEKNGKIFKIYIL